MSNTIRYDALLTRDLARELDALLAGQRVRTLHFDREARAFSLATEHSVLRWSLQQGPSLGSSADSPGGQKLIIPRKARVESVVALPDERVLKLSLGGGARGNAVRALVVELLPPQPNAIALDGDGRVLKMLMPGRSRPQVRGQAYAPPAPLHRLGTDRPLPDSAWLALLSDQPPGERAGLLSARVAYLSPLSAPAVLGPAAAGSDMRDLRESYDRYSDLLHSPPRPSVIRFKDRLQPYGHPLWQDALPQDSLLAAFAIAQESAARASDTDLRLEQAIARARKKRERLQGEGANALEEAQHLRKNADLLLSHAHTLKRGMSEVELADFEGGVSKLSLDPALSGTDNAQAWYAQARKRVRAAERIPDLIAATDRALAELQDKLQRARSGEVIPAPPAPVHARKGAMQKKLPYRRYRTGSGLEVRVGRSGRANDELTFHHARPEDVWLHARDVGGAHVVLRWSDPEANPPRRDLEQAAMLAALHSKARHAGTVPVDWTRRKYVRKPRNAPPGQVGVERLKTVFVSPQDARLEEMEWKD